MTSPPTSPVTQLLAAVRRGDNNAHERLWSAIYHELRSIARHQMAGDDSRQTLQPTALGIARRTVDKQWRLARAWLHRELRDGDSTTGKQNRR